MMSRFVTYIKSIRSHSSFPAMLVLLFMLAIVLFGCRNSGIQDKRIPLARVGDQYLYDIDLKGLIPENATARDSMLICKSYVNKWIHTQLMVQQAEKKPVF